MIHFKPQSVRGKQDIYQTYRPNMIQANKLHLHGVQIKIPDEFPDLAKKIIVGRHLFITGTSYMVAGLGWDQG